MATDTDELVLDERSDAVVIDERQHGYERSPSDVLRLIVFVALTGVAFVLTWWGRNGVGAFEDDVARLWSFITPDWERLLAGALEVTLVLTIILALLLPLVTGRFRMFGYVVLSEAVAALLMIGLLSITGRSEQAQLLHEIAVRGRDLSALPNPGTIAALTAAYVTSAAFMSQTWRRTAGWTLTVIVVLRFVATAHVAGDVLLALAAGSMVGAGVLALFGRPNVRPTPAAIAASLASTGLSVRSIHRLVPDTVGGPWIAGLDGGSELYVRVAGAQDRSADILFRSYRAIRFKHLGDKRPFSSLRRTIEHEALLALVAGDAAARTPRFRALATVGDDDMTIAYEHVEGRRMDTVGVADVDDAVLADMWAQVRLLRRHRIAHRDLYRGKFILDGDGSVWVVDFGRGEIAADAQQLDIDVAHLLTSTATLVGVDRAVEAAVRGIGRDAVAASLNRMQSQVLSTSTRAELKDHKGLLEELRATAATRCGVEAPQLEPVERVGRKAIFTMVMLVALTYFLLPQLADLPGIIDRVKAAEWVWAIPTVAASAVTYVGATIGLAGSVPERIRAIPTSLAQVATSYASLLAPAGLGGMALNVRYLQRVGVDGAVATSSVGLNTMAGFGTHIVMLVLFVGWAGNSTFGKIRLPDPIYFLYGVAAVVVVAAAALAVGSVRKVIATKLFPMIRKALGGLKAVITQPMKLAMVVGGSVLVTFAYMTALYFSSLAFGSTLKFAQVGAIFLAGSTIATIAPTPGGLGALEAALIAGFAAAGLDKEIAVPAVFFYRLATFWIPIAPGAWSFGWLRRNDYL